MYKNIIVFVVLLQFQTFCNCRLYREIEFFKDDGNHGNGHAKLLSILNRNNPEDNVNRHNAPDLNIGHHPSATINSDILSNHMSEYKKKTSVFNFNGSTIYYPNHLFSTGGHTRHDDAKLSEKNVRPDQYLLRKKDAKKLNSMENVCIEDTNGNCCIYSMTSMC